MRKLTDAMRKKASWRVGEREVVHVSLTQGATWGNYGPVYAVRKKWH